MEERNGPVDTKRSYAQAVMGLSKVAAVEQEGAEVPHESALPSISGGTSEAGQEDTASSAPPAEVKKYLVVDSGPLIARTPLGKFGDELWTVREVVAQEIKDPATRAFVDTLPTPLRFRHATPAATKRVVEFARKTGDFASLSSVDIKVLSLALTLELEKNGEKFLHSEPKPMQQYVPKEKPTLLTAEDDDEEESARDTEEKRSDELKDSAEGDSGDGSDDDDDDDEGWITSENFGDKFGDDFVAEKEQESDRVPVLCLTTDFAMQNVLLQMGLQLVASNGLRINRLKKWMMRCFACYLCIKELDRVFCPRCGNSTMKRVAVQVDTDGNITYFLSKRPLSKRGTKYSLPKPQYGSAKTPGKDMILTEDQLKRYERDILPMKKQHKKGMSAFDDPDYVFGARPEMTTVERRKLVGHKRRNPNRVKRKPQGNKRI